MNILITGVAGLLGSRLADWIIENQPDATVIGVDDLSGGYTENVHEDVIFYPLKVEEKELEEVFSKHDIDYVYHFAGNGELIPSIEKPYEYFKNNDDLRSVSASNGLM